eukprot:gene1011-1343_t
MQTCNVAKPGQAQRGVAHTRQIAFNKQQNARLASAMQAAATELVLPASELVIPKYCEAIHQTRRRPTRTVTIGPVKVGSEHPIALQTMTTTDTRNVQATVDQ